MSKHSAPEISMEKTTVLDVNARLSEKRTSKYRHIVDALLNLNDNEAIILKGSQLKTQLASIRYLALVYLKALKLDKGFVSKRLDQNEYAIYLKSNSDCKTKAKQDVKLAEKHGIVMKSTIK